MYASDRLKISWQSLLSQWWKTVPWRSSSATKRMSESLYWSAEPTYPHGRREFVGQHVYYGIGLILLSGVQPYLLWRLAVTPTFRLQLFLYLANLSNDTVNPVQVRIVSMQAVLGLPVLAIPMLYLALLLFQSLCFLIWWSKYVDFLDLILLYRWHSMPVCSSFHLLVFLAIQETLCSAVLLKLWFAARHRSASDWLPSHGIIAGITIFVVLK